MRRELAKRKFEILNSKGDHQNKQCGMSWMGDGMMQVAKQKKGEKT